MTTSDGRRGASDLAAVSANSAKPAPPAPGWSTGQRHDLGPHQCAVRHVERETTAGRIVTTAGQIAADEGMRMRGAATCGEIGHQEGDLLRNIHPAQGRIELQAVEGVQRAVPAHHVAAMQVAVALAHEAIRTACAHPWRKRVQPGQQCRALGLHALRAIAICFQRCGLFEIRLDGRAHHGRTAPLHALRGGWQRGVDVSQRAAEGTQFGRLGTLRFEQPVEFVLARELPHAHRVLQHRAVAAHPRLAAAMHDRAHVQIQRRGEAPVQAHLLAAQLEPALRLAHVQERMAHGTLDLVGKLAGQQHPGNVGLHQLHVAHGMRIGSRLEQPQQMFRK